MRQSIHLDAVRSDVRVVDGRDFDVGRVGRRDHLPGDVVRAGEHARRDDDDDRLRITEASRALPHQPNTSVNRASDHALVWLVALAVDVPRQGREDLLAVVAATQRLNHSTVFGLVAVAQHHDADFGHVVIQVLLDPLAHRVAEKLERVAHLDIDMVIDDNDISRQRFSHVVERRRGRQAISLGSEKVFVPHDDVEGILALTNEVLLRRQVAVVLGNGEALLRRHRVEVECVIADLMLLSVARPARRVNRVILKALHVEHAEAELDPLSGEFLRAILVVLDVSVSGENLIAHLATAARLLSANLIRAGDCHIRCDAVVVGHSRVGDAVI